MGELTWRLSDPGMDLLERAGLAALYSTLQAAEEQKADLAPLQWGHADLTPHSVTVRWSSKDRDAFVSLFQFAWQVRDGVIYAPAVHRTPIEGGEVRKRIPLHSGILSTFLQHGNVQPKGNRVVRLDLLDSAMNRSVRYEYVDLERRTLLLKAAEKLLRRQKVLKKGNHVAFEELSPKTVADAEEALSDTLKPLNDLTLLFDRKGKRRPHGRFASWIAPGTAARYPTDTPFGSNWQDKPWRVDSKLGLLLMLAPLTCLYLRFPGNDANWAIVIPDVRDLKEFDAVRSAITPDLRYVDVASIGDAALRFAAAYATRRVQKHLAARCRVVALGKVNYYQSQSVRKAILDLAARPTEVKRYQILDRFMPSRYEPFVRSDKGSTKRRSKKRKGDMPDATGFIKIPSGRGSIADNLVRGRPWYRDLFSPPDWERDALDHQRKTSHGGSPEELWFSNLSDERGALMQVIKEPVMWDRDEERVFVETFWDALRSRFGKEAKAAASRGGSRSPSDRFTDVAEEIRRGLYRAKTRQMLRATLAEFFASCGHSAKLKENVASVWRLADDAYEWQKARDLALLALASYPAAHLDNENGPASSGTEEENL